MSLSAESKIWKNLSRKKKIQFYSVNAYANYLNFYKLLLSKYFQEECYPWNGTRKYEFVLYKHQFIALKRNDLDEWLIRKVALENWNAMSLQEKEPFIDVALRKRKWLQKHENVIIRMYTQKSLSAMPVQDKWDIVYSGNMKNRRKRVSLFIMKLRCKYKANINRAVKWKKWKNRQKNNTVKNTVVIKGNPKSCANSRRLQCIKSMKIVAHSKKASRHRKKYNVCSKYKKLEICKVTICAMKRKLGNYRKKKTNLKNYCTYKKRLQHLCKAQSSIQSCSPQNGCMGVKKMNANIQSSISPKSTKKRRKRKCATSMALCKKYKMSKNYKKRREGIKKVDGITQPGKKFKSQHHRRKK